MSEAFASEGHEVVVEVVALGNDDRRGDAEARATQLQPKRGALALVIPILRDEQAREAGRWNERAEAAGGECCGGDRIGRCGDEREYRLDPFPDEERGAGIPLPEAHGASVDVAERLARPIDPGLDRAVGVEPGTVHALEVSVVVGDRRDQRRKPAPAPGVVAVRKRRVEPQCRKPAAVNGSRPKVRLGVSILDGPAPAPEIACRVGPLVRVVVGRCRRHGQRQKPSRLGERVAKRAGAGGDADEIEQNGMDASHLDAKARGEGSGPSRADGIYSAKGGSIRFPGNTGGSEMKSSKTIVGVDTAKRVFQLYWVEPETGEEMNVRLSRSKFLRHFANLLPCLVAMEACSGTQHWARQLQALGHEVRILPARTVSPFVRGNKNDAHDARGIWMAVQQPGLRTVAVKSEEQQGVLSLHRMREQLVKFRTAQINGLRGLLAEYGEVMPKGRAGLTRDIPGALERVSERLPAMVVDSLRDQWARILRTDEEIDVILQRLQLWHRTSEASRRLEDIPGVGVLTATAVVAAMGDPQAFRSGREFAAWLGLVPRHVGTGGRVRILGISKRGDRYLRTLLIHGARAVLTHTKAPSPWLSRLLERRPSNVVCVALANKNARTMWALLAHDRQYERNYVSQPA